MYLCTGNPLPREIQTILQLLLNADFQEAFDGVWSMQQKRGISLSDIVTNISNALPRLKQLPQQAQVYLLDKLSDIEYARPLAVNAAVITPCSLCRYRLSFGADEKLQLGALVGCFTVAKGIVFETKAAAS